MYGFNNTFAIALPGDIANEYEIDTYTDLAKKSNDLSFGAEYDFYEREDGYNALAKAYGFEFKEKKELDIGLKYQAIGNGDVDVINAFSTDAMIEKFGLKVLEDDKSFFPSYNASTIVRRETLMKYPELREVLQKLTGQISDEEMVIMNYEVEESKKSESDVAREFLKKKGLI